jgi:uncharacterized peroxidase-related enzyme
VSVIRQRPDKFTLAQIDWDPYIETVTEIGLSEDELARVYEVAPNAKASPYFATLALDLPALVQRTGVFSNAMRSPGGAPNSDRELAAVAVSRVNGCIYCASVHARLYVQYTKNETGMQRILDTGVDAEIDSPRERAIVDFAVRLTNDAAGITAADIAPLREVGLSELEIYDVAQSAAMFVWANRLMQTLGAGVYPENQ